MTQPIDAQPHFWRYPPEDYGWIAGDMAGDMEELRRDFLLPNSARYPGLVAEQFGGVGET